MSHNKITVANQSPDANGNISVSLSNLSDTTISSPSANEVVKYDGSNWINSTAPTGTGEYIQLGRGETYGSNYPFSTPTSTNAIIYMYDTNPVNTISSATLHQSSTTHWYDSVTLPIGKYSIICQTNVAFSASGYLVFNLKDASNNRKTASAKIGDNASGYAGGVVSTINSFIELTSSTRLYLKVDQVSNVSTAAADHNGLIDEFTYLIIIKV
jgi:hypothetical protein